MRTERHASNTEVLERSFSCSPDQVGQARRWAASVYAEAGADPDTSDTCCLLVSEVATNAVVHAGGDRFWVRIHRADLRVEVWDSSYKMPCRLPSDEDSEGGRGLELLDALAPGFEVVLGRLGKGVCFQPKVGS